MLIGWRAAMETALYGPGGFFTSSAPAEHFRTSVHASPEFAGAVLALIDRVDEALGRPERFEVVDVGAGRGELLARLLQLRPDPRFTWTGVEVAGRPPELDQRIDWRPAAPDRITGLLLATEWLDNVPLDLAEAGPDGRMLRVLVDPATGETTTGGPVAPADLFWLSRWWPARPGDRAEIGWPRDVAWADAVGRVDRGAALAVDYGHVRAERPALGTLTGFRGGRQVPPVPDGSCDLTAHVAMDAVAAAVGTPYQLCSQRTALKALGVHGGRPPLELAGTDPAGYLRALTTAGAAGELLDPAGLGGHRWLLHSIGIVGPSLRE